MSKKDKHKPSAAPVPSIPDYPFFGKVLLWAATLWMAVITIKYESKNFPPFNVILAINTGSLIPSAATFLHHLKLLGAWLLVFWGALSCGELFLRRLQMNALTRIVLAKACGFIVLSYVVFLGAAAKVLTPGFFWGVMGAILVFNIIRIKAILPLLKSGKDEFLAIIKGNSVWAILFLIAILGISFVMAFVPDFFYDSLVCHIAVPKYYLFQKGFDWCPILFSKFPMLMQMFNLLGMGIGIDLLGKMVHWSAGVLLALGLVAWGAEENAPKAGFIGAVIFLTVPMVFMNWWTSGIDVSLCLFVSLGAWTWAKSLKDEPAAEGTIVPLINPWVILTGVFAGAAFATKYTGGATPAFFVLLHFIARYTKDKNFKKAAIESLALGTVAFFVILPWLIKNAVFAGNPIYPFLSSVLKGDGYRPDGNALFIGENGSWTPKEGLSRLLLPWTWTFSDFHSISFPGPIPLALLPLGFIYAFKGSPRHLKWVTIFSALTMTLLLFSNSRSRYAMPFGAPMAFVMALALVRGAEILGSAFRVFSTILIVYMAGGNLLSAILTMHSIYEPWAVLTGREKPIDYLSYSHPSFPLPGTAVFEAAKEVLPKDGRLLVLGDEKTGLSNARYLNASIYDLQLPVKWAEGVTDEKAYYEIYKANHITHISVSLNEGRRLFGYKIFNWPDEAIALFAQFWEKHVRLVKQTEIPERLSQERSPLFLYEVLSEQDAKLKPVPMNIILFLFEEQKTNTAKEHALDRKIDLYVDLAKKFPTLTVFSDRLNFFESLKKASASVPK